VSVASDDSARLGCAAHRAPVSTYTGQADVQSLLAWVNRYLRQAVAVRHPDV